MHRGHEYLQAELERLYQLLFGSVAADHKLESLVMSAYWGRPRSSHHQNYTNLMAVDSFQRVHHCLRYQLELESVLQDLGHWIGLGEVMLLLVFSLILRLLRWLRFSLFPLTKRR